VTVPLDIEAVAADPIDTGEGGVEFLAEVIGEARAVTLQEPVLASVPFAPNIDRVVESCRGDGQQKAGFQDGVDEHLACCHCGGLFGSG